MVWRGLHAVLPLLPAQRFADDGGDYHHTRMPVGGGNARATRMATAGDADGTEGPRPADLVRRLPEGQIVT